MNRCPICQTIYEDQTLFFCLEDGTKLIPNQSSKYVIPTVVVTKKTPLPQLVANNQPKEIEPKMKSKLPFYLTLAAALIFIFTLATGGFAFWLLRGKNSNSINQNDKNAVKNSEAEKTITKTDNLSDSNEILDFSSPETFSYLEKEGLLIAIKSKSEKPNPLELILNICENGELTLNNLKLGNVSGENTLGVKLTEVFQSRELNRVTAEGANTIEKTVTIKPPTKISREIFEKTCRIVKDANPSSIKVLKP